MKLLELLFPKRCVFCGKITDDDGMVCHTCKETLPYKRGAKIKRKGDFFDFCISPLYYKGMVRQSVIRYKFSGKRGYSEIYGKILADCIAENLSSGYDIITWVPISKRRYRERGYDQGMLLANETAKALGKEAVSVLKKKKDTPPQSGIDGDEKRRANIMGAYEINPDADIEGKTVLLIDDVFTTGATMSECARTLLMGKAENVICATFASKE